MSDTTVRLIPLGGLGEVGKNMMALEAKDAILVIDTGIMFPENDMLGIDYIIPDFGYLRDKKHKVRAIVVTHGHEDHTGAIHHVLQDIAAPIYATRLTRGLLEAKLNRNAQQKATLQTIQAGESLKVGPFGLEFFHVCHSIPDGVGLAIDTPQGILIHSGDFKFDQTPVDGWPTNFAKLAELGQRGVLALLADSTNADKRGWTPSERVIDGAFDDVFRQASGRILIGTFASLISRMAQVAAAAERYDRVMAFVGASMIENAKIARRLGYLDIPEERIVPIDQALGMKPSKVVLMCTGTQGEPSSILGRLSAGTNRQFEINSGDTVVLSSHPIPGNEEMVHRTINRLLQRGADVVYDAIAPVHVSGHASQEEQRLLLQTVRPKYFIPIHGELRHLRQHARLALESGLKPSNIAVVENGTVIEFHKGHMSIGERIPGGYVFVDGRGVGDVGPEIMREREALARDGFVLVHVQIDPKTGHLRGKPTFTTRGFAVPREGEALLETARSRIRELVKSTDGNDLQSRLERDLGKLFFGETRRNPMVLVVISGR
jgi:ribonuclease J